MAKKIYLCGAMSGLPDFNYPAFHAAAQEIRGLGHSVESPAENPAPDCGSWSGYMRLSIRQLTMCEAVVLLPRWEGSKGAAAEVQIAKILGIDVYKLEDFINGA